MGSSGSDMDNVVLKVAVVGAGIAGLSAAIALHQAGHQVEVCKSFSLSLVSDGIRLLV